MNAFPSHAGIRRMHVQRFGLKIAATVVPAVVVRTGVASPFLQVEV